MFLFEEEDSLYDWVSCLIPDRFYFGPFPNQRMMNRLAGNGFNVIVNLTHTGEQELYRIVDAPPGFPERPVEIISYPIDDHSIPNSPETYCKLITTIKERYLSGKKIYLHCRGGHGRSSMVAVSAIYTILPYEFHEAVSYVNECHLLRPNLRAKWKKKRSPFNTTQYQFLSKIHKNIYLNYINTDRNHYYEWLIYTDPITTRVECNQQNQKNEKYNVYPSLLDLYNDTTRTYEQKCKILSVFLETKMILHNILPKLRLTYLKKFVLADCDKMISHFYHQVMVDIREKL